MFTGKPCFVFLQKNLNYVSLYKFIHILVLIFTQYTEFHHEIHSTKQIQIRIDNFVAFLLFPQQCGVGVGGIMDIMDIMDIIDITDITDTMVIMDIIDTVSTCLPDRTNLKASRTLIRISSIIFSRSASGRYSMNTVMDQFRERAKFSGLARTVNGKSQRYQFTKDAKL